MDNKKTGEFIATLRREKGMTQQELADIIYISREAISKWERGIGLPSIAYLLKLSDLFEVSVNEIIYGERASKINEGEVEQATLKLLDKVSTRAKKIRRSFIITVFILAVIYFVSYFIYNYNSIRVYVTYYGGENYTVDQGLIIVSRQKLYFKLGNIEQKDDEEINKITLYYKNKNDYITLLSREDLSEITIDLNKYHEILKTSSTSKIINNLYVELESDSTKEMLKLESRLDFQNDYSFAKVFDKNTADSDDDILPDSSTAALSMQDKIKDKFVLKDGKYTYSFTEDKIKYECEIKNDEIHMKSQMISIIYRLDQNKIYIGNKDVSDIYDIETNTCSEGDCDRSMRHIDAFIKHVLN